MVGIVSGEHGSATQEAGMGDPVIIGGARTGIGRLLGSLAGLSAAELGGFAIKGALDRARLTPDQVEYVIMGHVLQAGGGPNNPPPAAGDGGLPVDPPAPPRTKSGLARRGAVSPASAMIQRGPSGLT